jgi:hypothetical protein
VKSSTRRLFAAGACFLMVILSAGCAALTSMTVKQETLALEERVTNYMQAQINKKWDLTYSFFDSSSREKISRESYVYRTRTLSYKKFEIEEITLLPSWDQATVRVKITISFMTYQFTLSPQTQNWVKENGAWFVKYEPRSQKNPFSNQEKKP